MYNQYFGFSESPFSIAPNPRFLFMSKRHKEALAHLLYGVGEGGGFVMLTGEVGTGKTTICRCLLEQLPENCELAFVLNPKLTSLELLASICDDLEINYNEELLTVKSLMDALSNHLIKTHQAGRRVVLMIDEAQNLSAEVLEQVRLLTNLETNTEKLLQIILIGQPELKTLLNRRVLRQLAQRVTARYHLEPLTQEETLEYISHRLNVAGQRFNPFTEKSIKLLHHISGGIPRLINSICDRALLGAYVLNKKHVEPKVIKKACKEVLGDQAKELIASNKEEPAIQMTAQGLYVSKKVLLTVASLFIVVIGGVAFWGVNSDLSGTGPFYDRAPINQTSSGAGSTGVLSTPELIADATDTENKSGLAGDAASKIPTKDEWFDDEVPSEKKLLASVWQQRDWERDRNSALRALFSLWRIDYNALDDGGPCGYARKHRLKCESDFGSWRDLLSFNRPALLKFVTEDKGHFFGTLVKVDKTEEGLYGDFIFGNEKSRHLLSQLSIIWSGQYTLLWHLPPGYKRPVGSGTRGEVVTWLSEKLAAIAGASTYEAITQYDSALAKRIKQFQRQNRLVPDGVAGAQTMIIVNTYVNDKVPLLYVGEQPNILAQWGSN